MTGAHSTPTPRLADRLLTEVVRVREEAAGHPADVPQADAAGRQAGGALTRRILARAAALPDAAALQRAIRQGDGDHLFDYFTRTRAIRRGIIEAGQDTDAPDFGRGARRKGEAAE